MLAVHIVIITACWVTNIDSDSVCCCSKTIFFATAVGRKEKIQQTKNRDRVNQIWGERNKSPPTGKPAKLLISLYGQKLPKRLQDRLGSWVSMNHGATGRVDQTRACMNAALRKNKQVTADSSTWVTSREWHENTDTAWPEMLLPGHWLSTWIAFMSPQRNKLHMFINARSVCSSCKAALS